MLQAKSPSDPGPLSLLQRMRRMGLIITGNQNVADAILRDAFHKASAAFASAVDANEDDIFKLGFDAFYDAVHRKGVVVLIGRASKEDGSLWSAVHNLTYFERLSIALLLVEEMSPREAAILSGRPPQTLELALEYAVAKLGEKGI